MLRTRGLVIAVLAFSVIAVSCGDNRDNDSSGVTAGGPATPSSLPGQSESQAPPPPQPILEDVSSNPNVRDGGLGSVCWARWEVQRHLLQMDVAFNDDARKAQAIDSLQTEFDDVNKALAASETNVTAELSQFVTTFRGAITQAQREAPEQSAANAKRDAIARAFDWESFRGLAEYGAAATQSANCVRP